MKIIMLRIGILFLLVFVLGAGCNKDERDPKYYKGKVVSLNHGNGCSNIIEIIVTINNGGLPIGSTITFDPKLYKENLIEGDIVYFKIIQYEEWVGFGTANCLWPKYTAQIEFHNN
jgi:hypothetical protein